MDEIRLLLQLLNDPRMRTSPPARRPSWTRIARAMREAGYRRDVASVRNHYARHLKGRAKAANGEAKNRCGVCGQIKAGHECPGWPSVRPAHLPPAARAPAPSMGALGSALVAAASATSAEAFAPAARAAEEAAQAAEAGRAETPSASTSSAGRDEEERRLQGYLSGEKRKREAEELEARAAKKPAAAAAEEPTAPTPVPAPADALVPAPAAAPAPVPAAPMPPPSVLDPALVQCEVILFGLVGRRDLNGRVGTVVLLIHERGRYRVKLSGEEVSVDVQPSNVTLTLEQLLPAVPA